METSQVSRASSFSQRDLEKALRAAKKQATHPSAVVVTRSGDIRFEFANAGNMPAVIADTPDAELARWKAECGR